MVWEEPMDTNTDKSFESDSFKELQLLQSWFSPSFPIGSYSYSHGLESLIEEKIIQNKSDVIDYLIGIIFNETIGFSFYSLGLSVGIAVTLMIYLKVMHPPAASNPLVVLFTDVSFEFILFPVIFGAIAIIIMSVFINKVVLKRKYPKKKNWLY